MVETCSQKQHPHQKILLNAKQITI